MTETQDWAGRIAVVTGAARGIGEAISRRVARMGAHVVLVARHPGRLDTVRRAIEDAGGHATALPLDLRQPSAFDQLAATLRTLGNRCDLLVNNAAVGRLGKPLYEMTDEEWDETMETNLRAPFLALRCVAPLMIAQKSGHILNISSLAGTGPLVNGAAYSASKWGLNGLTYSAAEELRDHGVRVAVIMPGSVNTDFGGGQSRHDDSGARKLQPEDVADVVETLLRQPPQSFISEVKMRPARKK